MSYSEWEIQRFWEKARVAFLLDPKLWRVDRLGMLMYRNSYGDRSNVYGWEIDHHFPESKGGSSNPGNLEPMNWKNNAAKSDDFPFWFGK